MTDNPILSFSLGLFGILVAAFVVGALLFQFRFRAVWCFAACEAFFLLWYFYAFYPVDPHRMQFNILQVLSLCLLLPPTYLGYYFNKHILHF
ncbi:hypothetical protein [Bradyrhizobium retamae]|uniref:Uncharacterized protein n=1 Tax=Bradyrhizobium retamae TaxID=1300035 RepID=A0A0R3N146_9BRAD|nr:hypothetical protein [Bradyrhizobium retamae]KRR23925.1 hypothetical protein CQ13_26440 [Bradyrhizobium retamae]